jgi:hypothetical protein
MFGELSDRAAFPAAQMTQQEPLDPRNRLGRTGMAGMAEMPVDRLQMRHKMLQCFLLIHAISPKQTNIEELSEIHYSYYIVRFCLLTMPPRSSSRQKARAAAGIGYLREEIWYFGFRKY